MSLPPTTRQVAALLGTTYHRLFRVVSTGLIPPPQKTASGDYVWTEEDMDRAREALKIDRRHKAHRPQATPAQVSA